MRRTFQTWYLFLSFLLIGISASAQQAKYVFFFIGDGMGVNQVLGTEMYRAEIKGYTGIDPLLFTQFPHYTNATTYSGSNKVTDSAASGTALACGHKSKNGAFGLTTDLQTQVNSIAYWAKQAGKKVGVATSVSVDHATPAAFYAHQPHRSLYYKIGIDLANGGYDFYAGSDFLDPTNKKGKDGESHESLYDMVQKKGYTIARGYKDYRKKANTDKMLLLQNADAKDPASIPYAIDRKKGDLSLSDITRAGIHSLMRNNDKGFFFMVEGGKIDWACHSNDAATMVHEVMDFDDAIRVAYEFYQQHPDETLIVISADHETGGLVLGTGAYDLNLKVLQHQKMSEYAFTRLLSALRKDSKKPITWEKMKQLLTTNFGFWKEVKLNEAQESRLKKVYDDSFAGGHTQLVKSEYQADEAMANVAMRILNEIAMVGWTSGGHSAGYVPVYAIGTGSELFMERIDNTEIPKRMAKAAGYTIQ